MADSNIDRVQFLCVCSTCGSASFNPVCYHCDAELQDQEYPYCLACNEANDDCTCLPDYDPEAPCPGCDEAYHSCLCELHRGLRP